MQSDHENGNVLFLILIAVALFAALSYAVTQSTRGGGEGTDSENSLILSSQLTQHSTSVKIAVTRMTLSGIDPLDLEFNLPSDLTACSSPEVCVFHSDGGGATYAPAPVDLMSTGIQGDWIYSFDYAINHVGTTGSPSEDRTELIAFLPRVSSQICERLHQELGINPDPISIGPWDIDLDYYNRDNTASTPGGYEWSGSINGLSEGCVYGYDINNLLYFKVLLER